LFVQDHKLNSHLSFVLGFYLKYLIALTMHFSTSGSNLVIVVMIYKSYKKLLLAYTAALLVFATLHQEQNDWWVE
jgi:hypothetical protein